MRKIFLFLLLGRLALLLTACSSVASYSSRCVSGKEELSDNFITGERGGDATIATFCTDKNQYNKGDIVHITLTVKNALNKQIVLGGGQQPVMDICTWPVQCLSKFQATDTRLTHLVLKPGQSYTLQWDWPSPGVDMKEALGSTNQVRAKALWIGAGGEVRELQGLKFTYGVGVLNP